MANTVDFNVGTNAMTVLNQTAEATKNAKQELKELQKQMLSLDADSAEFQKAAARAGELKDQMNDAADAIRTSTGPALESMNSTFSIMQGQLTNLDFGGLGQSFTSLGRAVEKINFKTLKDELGGLVKGLGSLAGAIISNPLLALGGAVALLVVNFDKINAALSGTAEKVEKLGEANVALEKQNLILDAQINKQKTLYGESFKTLELEKEKALNNVQVAENELAIARTTGDINTIREKENKLIEMRNLLSGITAKGEADRAKLVEEAKNLTIEGYKEDQSRRAAIAKFEDGRAQQLAVIAEKQRLIKANLQKEELIGTEKQYTTERANFVQKDIETKKVLVVSDRQKQLQKELNDLLAEEQILRNAKLAIATETTVEDLKQKDNQKEETERAKTQFQEIKSLGLQRIEFTKDTTERIFSQEDALNKRIIESQKKVEEHQKEILAKRVQMTSDAFGALSSLTMAFNAKSETAAKNQFKINKAFSLSQAIINTYQAVNAALTAGGNPAKLATGAQFVEAGIALTAGLANVIKIQQTQFGGANSAGGGGNLGGVGSGGGGTTAPSPANFAFLQNQPNQQPPLQAYVVSTQVSSNLEAQQLINNQARLGG
jgi:hypothetical protein